MTGDYDRHLPMRNIRVFGDLYPFPRQLFLLGREPS